VLVLGGVFLELVFADLGDGLRPGGEAFASSFGISCGGAVTVAATARRRGASVGLVTTLGDDFTSKVVTRYCLRRGIALDQSPRVAGVSSGITVALNFSHDRAFVTYHPERAGGGRPDAASWAEAIRQVRPSWIYLHAGPEAVGVVQAAAATGCRVALDVDLGCAEEHPAAVLECLEAAELFLPNEDELRQLGRAESLEGALGPILRRCPTVVVTRGPAGALLATGSSLEPIGEGLSDVEVVDRTGAGDSFAGALIGELALGRPLREAIAVANAAGSKAVSRLGATGALALEDLAVDGAAPPAHAASDLAGSGAVEGEAAAIDAVLRRALPPLARLAGDGRMLEGDDE